MIVLGRVMHSGRPAVGIETLRLRTAGIFRDWRGRPALRLACCRPLRRPLKLRHGLGRARSLRRLRFLVAAAETDRCKALHQ